MANNQFNVAEMLKIAILMEEEGYKFYTDGAKCTSGDVKKFLTVAAGQEFVHKEKFKKMFDKITSREGYESDYLFDSDVTEYLRGLIENKVFDHKNHREDEFEDLKTAVQQALENEKLTVEVYSKMYDGVSKQEVKDMLSAILEEEKEHVAYFSKLFKSIE